MASDKHFRIQNMNKLATLRKRAKMTQTQLGEKTGLSRQAIIAIENGHNLPSLKHALKISRIFDETVDSLFGDEEYR